MKTDPGMAGRLIEQEERFGIHRGRAAERLCCRGEGIHLWDVQGNRYLDFLPARFAPNQGHTHTRIAAALVEQGLRLPMAPPSFRQDRLPPLLEKLCSLSGFEAALPLGSAEGGLQAALLAARAWAATKGLDPLEAGILVFSGSGLPGPASGFVEAPYGSLAAARAQVGPGTCAILVEPVQGRDVVVAPRGFLKGLRELCDEKGLLLLADERQSGLCRTGKWFGFEQEGIRPDGAVLGHALGGGFHPASAFLATREVMDLLPPEMAGSACGPMACAVFSAALDVLSEEHLADRSAELGAYFLARLRGLESQKVREIRGLGLWAGLDLRESCADSICETLALQGLLCEASSERVMTLSPPLVITREQLDGALEKLERVL